MALSGTISGAYRGYTLQTTWTATQNTAGNYSDITATHRLVCDSTYALYIDGRTNSCTVDSGLDNLQVGDRLQLCRPVKNVERNEDGTLKRARHRYKVIKGNYYEITQDDIDRIATSGTASSTFTIPVEYCILGQQEEIYGIVREYKWTYTGNGRFRSPLVVRVQRKILTNNERRTISNHCKIMTKGVNTESLFTFRPL